MQGHGYRVYGLSGTTYSGQFDNGVMHGQGLLKKTNGEQYEGSWTYGKKEGTVVWCRQNTDPCNTSTVETLHSRRPWDLIKCPD